MLRLHEPSRDEWRDAIDARWTAFLARCGLRPLYMPNDVDAAAALLDRVQPAGAVLTGGGSCSALGAEVDDRDRTEAMILEWTERRGLPTLGVCRGMQVMLARAGGRLECVEGHVGRQHVVTGCSGARSVNSYHDYGLRDVPEGFVVEARSVDGVVEAARHSHLRLAAIMWHPERMPAADPLDVSTFRAFFGGMP